MLVAISNNTEEKLHKWDYYKVLDRQRGLLYGAKSEFPENHGHGHDHGHGHH